MVTELNDCSRSMTVTNAKQVILFRNRCTMGIRLYTVYQLAPRWWLWVTFKA